MLFTIGYFVAGGGSIGLDDFQACYWQSLLHADQHYWTALLGLTGLYTVLVTLFVVPPSAPLSFISGVLFGPHVGTMVSLVAKSIGGSVAFLGWRYSLSGMVERRLNERARRLSETIGRRGLWYLLGVRLMPIFPFGTVTLAAALTPIRLRQFIPATFFGQAPASFIYASAGAGVRILIEQGQAMEFGALDLGRQLLLPTTALGVFSVVGLIAGHYLDPQRKQDAAR